MGFKTYKYKLPFKPDTVNSHWIITRRGKALSKEGKQFRKDVQNYIKLYKIYRFVGDIKVRIKLFFKDKRKRDVDNYLKGILDSFNGILWNDDSQIYCLQVTKELSKDNFFEIEIEGTEWLT